MTATAPAVHNGKIAYKEWVRFKTDLERLRKHHSWRELAQLFKKDGQGWAEAAARHRSIVEPKDVIRAAELVAELLPEKIVMQRAPMEPVAEPVEASSPEVVAKDSRVLNEAERAELQQGLQALYQEHGTWTAVTQALGKNVKSSGAVKYVAIGKVGAGRPFLDRLRQVQRGETVVPVSPSAEPLKPRKPATGSRRRARPRKLTPLTEEGRAEVQRLLGEMGSMPLLAGALGCTTSHLYNVRKTGHASNEFLAKVHALHALNNRDPADVKAPSAETSAAEPPSRTAVATTPVERPWNKSAQEHLFAAASAIELEISKQPKVFRVPLQQFVTRITDLMDELSDG